jgi:hypothetical protein
MSRQLPLDFAATFHAALDLAADARHPAEDRATAALLASTLLNRFPCERATSDTLRALALVVDVPQAVAHLVYALLRGGRGLRDRDRLRPGLRAACHRAMATGHNQALFTLVCATSPFGVRHDEEILEAALTWAVLNRGPRAAIVSRVLLFAATSAGPKAWIEHAITSWPELLGELTPAQIWRLQVREPTPEGWQTLASCVPPEETAAAAALPEDVFAAGRARAIATLETALDRCSSAAPRVTLAFWLAELAGRADG